MHKTYELSRREQLFLFVGVFIYLILLISTWGATEESLILIILGFLPTSMYVLINIFHAEYTQYREISLFLLPVLLGILFFALSATFPVSMDIASLTVINVAIMYVFSILFVLLTLHRKKATHTVHEHHPNPLSTSYPDGVHSEEDEPLVERY